MSDTKTPNRGQRPTRVRSERANMPVPPPAVAASVLRTADADWPGHPLTRADLATGRGLTYEWEFFVDRLFRLIEAGGGGTGGTGVQSYEYRQSQAGSSWTITHGFGGYPSVLILDDNGHELHADLHYPDEDTVVVIHGQPYSGTAYLRL